MVDGLLDDLMQAYIYVQSYIDDIVLMVQDNYCNIVADRLSAGLQCFSSWCLREGLNVNTIKTIVVLFTRKQNLESLSQLNLEGTQLTISISVKCLGLTLDLS